jgi:hypothetical protein
MPNKGLGFFDEEHGVTGAAPNKIELHPVIYVRLRAAFPRRRGAGSVPGVVFAVS